MRLSRTYGLIGAALVVLSLAVLVACRSDKKSSSQTPKTEQRPTLRIVTFGGAAGAIEPCGCVKDMLGGVDHAAALVKKSEGAADGLLVLGAGPMFYQDPVLPPETLAQADLKAEAMALSLSDLGLSAWAPGGNDWARGVSEFKRAAKLSGARPLAMNLPPESGVTEGEVVLERAGLKVGLLGISLPAFRGGSLPFSAPESTPDDLKAGISRLEKKGAKLTVALIAAPRGQALRLVESVPELSLAVLGKPFDQGEDNDDPFEPMLLGQTLVVQGQNHLQGAAIVDLFVEGDDFSFQDGSGLEQAQRRASLERRIQQLESRLSTSRAMKTGPGPAGLEEKEKELSALKKQLEGIERSQPPEKGSYFLYDLTFVRESLGEDPAVGSRLLAYYKRVNELNRERFKDKRPQPAAEGQSSYVGIDQCTTCHQEERVFWDSSRHAQAYATLEKDHKQFNLDCVSCHVTGYEKPGGSTVTFVDELTSVQCETCHGPGSRHVTSPADPELIQSAPSPDLCPTCHHPPHVTDDWTVGEAWPHVIGPGHGQPAAGEAD